MKIGNSFNKTMNFFDNLYKQSLQENEKNLKFWEDYLHSLNLLDLKLYFDKLKVDILVPIGNRILFRGALKHTNEVTVALGADYFVKCSLNQAEVLRQHRIKDAQSKVDVYRKEKTYLQSQLNLNKETIQNKCGQDIIETCTDEEDKLWRIQHRERLRQYNLSKEKKNEDNKIEINDKELWERLEELELQEELENQMMTPDGIVDTDDNINTRSEKEDSSNLLPFKANFHNLNDLQKPINNVDCNRVTTDAHILNIQAREQTSNDLLEQVLNRQKHLENKLLELKNMKGKNSKTENDLLSRLDEIEKLEEVEDEMDRLENILDDAGDDNNTKNVVSDHEKRVSFACDDDDVETFEITFKHSDVVPSSNPYRSESGIMKPSDIYVAFSHMFTDETKSILKRDNNIYCDKIDDTDKVKETQSEINRLDEVRQEIIIKDVLENKENYISKQENNQRPASIFKKQRLKQKLLS
ncbi:unconventional prefoldin RPB5 interactor 1 [Leptidea sinapis]|uniref:unconventional prefoldin RPB5 interactor 1 n=1 Tax=Leptidea sinapis TaxID=189913 RepID=UPI00213DE91B|nr:unconventional prefoldin RPB5 interactor 1 [Leptidea sinapis]